MFVPDGLRKNFLHVVRFCAQSTIFKQFNKKCFQYSEGHFQNFSGPT